MRKLYSSALAIFKFFGVLLFLSATTFSYAQCPPSSGVQFNLSPPNVTTASIQGQAGSRTESFDSRSVGVLPSPGALAIGTTTSTVPNNVQVYASNVWGGTGTNFLGIYSGAFLNVTLTDASRYLGFWWGAGDAGNTVKIYGICGGNEVLLATFTTSTVLNLLSGPTVTAVDGNAYASSLYRRSNAANEPFAYINLQMDDPTIYFSRLEFGGGGFEIDNITTAIGYGAATNTVPGAPTISAIATTTNTASVTFTAPTSNGGSAITNYEYTTDGGTTWAAFSPASTSSPATITGLTPATAYVIKIRAVNSIGAGPTSNTINSTTSSCTSFPTIATVSNQTVTDGSQTTAINFSQSANNSGYQWMTFNSINATSASATGQNGITSTISQSGGGMGSHNGMYDYSRFPATYNIPAPPISTIMNTARGVFTVTFSRPVTNPLVAFASVGSPGNPVPVIVSSPFTPIWTDNSRASSGWVTTYDLPNRKFTGSEGFNIIRIDGTVTSVSFDYTVAEYYCTMAFGFEDQNVSFSWTNNNTSIGLPGLGTGNILPFTAVNTGTSPAVATIIATPVSADGCSGTSTTFTITVNPSATAGTLSGTQTICAGSTSQFSTDGTSGGTWSSSNISVATISSSGLVTGIGAGTATITYTVAGFSATRTVTVTAAPDAGVLSGIQAICVGGTSTFTPFVSIGNGLSFDGANDYVSIPKSITGDFTIEYWVKTSQVSPTGGQWYMGSGIVDAEVAGETSDFGTSLLNNKLSFGIGSPDITIQSTSNINTGNWTHVAATWKESTREMKLYVNGILEATGTSGTGSRNAPPEIRIGSLQTGINNFDGSIDELRIWNTVRTQAQISSNRNNEVETNAALVAYYKFNQGVAGGSNSTVTSLTDNSGNSNTGTLSNFALTGSRSNWVSGASVESTGNNSSGTWSSSSPTVATVSSSGLIQGIAAGTSTITYSVTGTGVCSNLTSTSTRTVTVTAPPSSGTLSGVQTAFIGATTTFVSTVTGGSWSSSNTAVATVSASTGVVTAVATGTATITYTVAGTGGCASVSATRTVTVYACPTIPALSASAYPVCAESSFTLTAAGLSGMSSLSSGIIFKYSTTALTNPYVGGTVIATIPFASLEAASTVARTTTSMATGGTYYIYAILSSTPGGTGCLPYATTTLVVNPKGQVTVPSDIVVCHGTSVAAQTLSTTNSGGTTTYAWTNSATSIGLAASGSTGTIPAFTATNTGATAVTATIAVTPTYTAGGLSCAGPVTSYTVTVNPVPVLSSVANQVICAGSTGAVNFNSSAPGTSAQSLTVSSGAISLAIPDASATGVSSALAVTVPTGATISGISVNFNITHTWDSDLTINLVAPNGQVLNLVRSRGGSGDNFTNTTISSASTTSLLTGSAPFTGTFAADAVTGVGPTAYTSTAANFAALYTGITSGNWRLAVRDGGSGDVGTITSWSITINYNPPPSINWTNSNTAIGLAASGVGNINFTATNPGPNQITSNLTATPFFTNAGLTCTGTPINFTIAVNPVGQVNTVNNQVLCNGSATSAVTFVTTNNGLISSGGSQTATSGTISVAVPDATAAGVTNTIPVSLPAGAVISNVRVTLNMTHTYISDMVINLKAPNGQVLNLFNQHGGNGDNLVNTVVSSAGTTTFGSASAPFTGTFAATAAIGQGPTGNVSNAANFAALYSTPNGNWTLAMQDLWGGDLGTLTSWSISFDYAVQGTFGTNMNWTNSASSIGLAASGTGHIPSFTATNTGTTPVTSTVTVTPVYFNGGTNCAGTPITYTYTVNPTPTVNTVATQTLCVGTPATVSHTGTVTGTVYSWTNSNTAIGLAASGTGNISFTPTNTGTTPITATITVTPSYTNAGVTCTGTPKTYTIMVNPVGQVNAVISQVLCNGSATTAVAFATVNGGGTVTPGTPITASSGAITVAIPDANAAGVSHTIPVTLPASSVVTKVTANFNITHTWAGDLTINLVAPNGQVLNLVNRQGGSGDNFTNTTVSPTATATFAGGTAPFTGTFLPDAAIGAGSTSFPSTAANFAALYSVGSGDWKLVLRDHAGGDVGTLTGWSLTFEYGALIPAVTSYAWTNNTPSIGLAASGSGNIASFTATNTTAAPVTSTVTVTPTYTNNGTGCVGTPITYTYTVNPTPTVNVVANQTVCRGSNVAAITFSGATTGTVYTWTNSNTAVGLAASGTGDIASFVGTNTTAAPITATITVTPRYTNAGVTCVGTPRTFTITVNPIPTVNAVNSFPVCHNSPVSVPFSGATTGTVYSWTNTNPAIGLAASGTGNLSFTATNPSTGGAPITATITVTPSYTNNGVTCVGTPTSFTITVNPLPVVSAGTLPSRICISDTLVKLNGTPVGGSWSGIGTSGTNFIPTATNIGSYALTYTYADINGCVNRASITANVLACEERNRDLDNEAVILYPNPNSGQFNLRINSTRFNVLGMKVYNAAGQLVSVKQWGGLVYARVIPVNLTNLAAGIYVVRLYYGDGMDRGADKSYQIIIAR